jgi:hypothetical protein
MDITREKAYLLCYAQRTEYNRAGIGNPVRNARPDGPESSGRARPENWERIAGVIGRLLKMEGQE